MMKRLLTLFVLLIFSISLKAQRVSYPELVHRTQLPTIFINDLVLPGDSATSVLAFTFRFNNDFLPFKKVPLNNELNAPQGAEYYSIVRLNSEIFEGKAREKNEALQKSISRDLWSDTLFTPTFEQTKSDDKYASGALSTSLQPGMYNYILQLNLMQSSNDRNTRRMDIKIPDFKTKKTGEVLLIRNVEQTENRRVFELMNMDNNVPFGENFYALIRIPNYEKNIEYEVRIKEAQISRRDTISGKNIASQVIADDEIFTESTISLLKTTNPKIELKQGNAPFTYALVNIPNENFLNASYLLHVVKPGQDKPVAKVFFRSYWPDMPASLYNLDTAINMLKFIVSEKELENLHDGNNQEKERKFREFWKSKDPTPNTVYNELMAEYYRRIDYAFNEFGTPENIMGHEKDQGEIYIKFGPPDSKERVFPAKGEVRELWKYPNRTFVFKATSGFGDFVLAGTR